MDDFGIVIGPDGREMYTHPDWGEGGLYVDEVRAMTAGAEERRKQPRKPDDLDELAARLRALLENYTGPARISRSTAELAGIPLDHPAVLPEDGIPGPSPASQSKGVPIKDETPAHPTAHVQGHVHHRRGGS
ncbi:hypothetical protein [Nonomuraea sp. NPDC049784]|uniref:hypothetical protein n=1 Tax=Nonomuraea sp. NPDC049784 TaxID=3154361 RepID=UPI0033C8EFD7